MKQERDAVFDYTFDYVIVGVCRIPVETIAGRFQYSEAKLRKQLTDNGFTLAFRDGKWFCDDFPSGILVIVEVMTSSTCSGNKTKGNTVSRVFEDTVYSLNGERIVPIGPAINYRQIWARMASQLLVKSQIAIAWGGAAFWVLQDLLADYISKTTALNLSDFLSDHSDEVNILSCGYGDNIDPKKRTGGFVDIGDVNLFAGPVSSSDGKKKAFVDIIKLGCSPKIEELWKRLASKPPCASFEIN